MLKLSVKGLDEVRAYLASMGKEIKHVAEGAVTEYLVGDEKHGLKHYPPYKHVSYKQAYGGFLSDAQRRYVMAMIQKGEITPGVSSSNNYFADAWKVEDKGRYWQAVNDVAHGKYLIGDTDQSKMMELKGWRKFSQNISDNLKGAFRHAQAKVKEWLKEHKKG